MRPTILVTGGAGYIGSHTCMALQANGFIPITYDNFFRGHHEHVLFGPSIQGDLLDTDKLLAVFKKYSIHAVIHFAGLTYVNESMTQPELYYQNNVGGSLSLLRAMLTSHVRSIVFSSTCATYGIPKTIPLTEEHDQYPLSSYGTSKLMVESMLRDFARAHAFSCTALRYFNAAGAVAPLAELHEPETHLIPLALKAAHHGTPLTIFGTDYETPDGTCIRDYIHVADLADAHVKALSNMQGFQAFNLGSEHGHSVKDVITAVTRVTGRSLHVLEGPRRIGDPTHLIASSSKAFQAFGWRPKNISLDGIIQSAFDAMQKNI